MKKVYYILSIIVIILCVAIFSYYKSNNKVNLVVENNIEVENDVLRDDTIYFFSHYGCPYCNDALEFIAINFDKLNMKILDTNNREDLKLFIKCAEKFNLDKSKLGTPLICMGDKYFMGWGKEYEEEFKKYAQNFLKVEK